ncbi:MAG: hypothetical protein ACRD35_03135 [Candidatus Acidiferrales bacterium]
MPRESELEAAVEQQLRDAKVSFVKQPVVGNTRPDFLVTTDHGDQIVVEVKAWEASPDNTARAIHQAQRYKELSKAAAALIVTAGAAFSLPAGGVVPLASFLPALTRLAASLGKQKRTRKTTKSRPSPIKKVFASMPFSGQYDDTFLVAIQPAALALNAAAERVDHSGHSGDVVLQIKQMISGAQVVVADISDSRPNVCHEVGYAEGFRRPVIQICSTPLASLPFNLRNNQTIAYHIGQVSKLRTRLEKELAKML